MEEATETKPLMTRQEYLAAYTAAAKEHGWVPGVRTEEYKAACHKIHVAYDSQFITPAVRSRVTPYVQSGRMPSIPEIDRVMIPCPACVNRLMRAAGDYPTPAGLVSIFKVAYEIIAKEQATQ
jgi:hypothetical protein